LALPVAFVRTLDQNLAAVDAIEDALQLRRPLANALLERGTRTHVSKRDAQRNRHTTCRCIPSANLACTSSTTEHPRHGPTSTHALVRPQMRTYRRGTTFAVSPAMTARPGDVLGGKYVLRHRIGEGGMGTVFLADQPLLGRTVAIKVLHPNLRASA